MNSTILNKEVLIKTIGEIAKIKIFPGAQEAIDKNWESLFFSANDITFATVEINGYIVSLETNGDIKVVSNNTDSDVFDDTPNEVYINKDVSKIREILEKGQISGYVNVGNELKKYYVDNNNWFSATIGKIVKREADVIQSEYIDDEVFELCPKTIEELEEALIEFATCLYTNNIN